MVEPSIQNKNKISQSSRKKVTVIFQGPIGKSEASAIERSVLRLKSIVQNKNLEIIISTWDDCEMICFDVDKIVRYPNLETYTFDGFKPCNVHKIIFLAKAALAESSGDVIIRLRSDLEIINPAKLMRIALSYQKPGRMFRERVVVIDYSTNDPMRFDLEIPYHVCDWVHIGLASDVKKIFQLPLPDKTFYSYHLSQPLEERYGKYVEAIRSEAYVTSFIVRRSYWSKCKMDNKISEFQKMYSNLAIANDYSVFNLSAIGLASIKHKTNNFDPNRLTKIVQNIWLLQLDQRIPKWIRRLALVLLYYPRPLYKEYIGLKRKIKSIITKKLTIKHDSVHKSNLF